MTHAGAPRSISILMPSYNQSRYLRAAIESVLSQEYRPKELIVIDGGSTDGSLTILREYGERLSYWVSEPDAGQSDALNKALRRATGDIIGWLNSDDRYLPGTFARIARAFERHPDAILVHGDRVMIDQTGLVCGWTASDPFEPSETGYCICSETAFWRRPASSDVAFNTELQFAMDLDFFCRLYRLGRFVKLNAYLGAFRCYPENKSSTLPGVCKAEADRQWELLFPEHHHSWAKRGPTRPVRLLSRFIQHPRTIALPYLYRRLWLRRRGVVSTARPESMSA